MRKHRQNGPGPSARDAAFEAKPDMQNLDFGLRELLKVPKTELDAKIEAEKKEHRERD